jgi:hypothetical protein
VAESWDCISPGTRDLDRTIAAASRPDLEALRNRGIELTRSGCR